MSVKYMFWLGINKVFIFLLLPAQVFVDIILQLQNLLLGNSCPGYQLSTFPLVSLLVRETGTLDVSLHHLCALLNLTTALATHAFPRNTLWIHTITLVYSFFVTVLGFGSLCKDEFTCVELVISRSCFLMSAQARLEIGPDFPALHKFPEQSIFFYTYCQCSSF